MYWVSKKDTCMYGSKNKDITCCCNVGHVIKPSLTHDVYVHIQCMYGVGGREVCGAVCQVSDGVM